MNLERGVDLSQAEVLVVDDTRSNLDLLYKILTREGYRVAVAPSGEVALSIAPELLPDLILLDVMMPGMDGFETCLELKQLEATRNIPVVFVTALGHAEDIVRGFNAGAVDYITKPIRQQEVCARVRAHLQNQILLRQRTALERAIEQRKSSESTVDELSAAIVTVSPPGLIGSANPAAIEMYGYTLKELIGRSFTELLAPDHGSWCRHIFSSESNAEPVLEVGDILEPREVSGVHKDGDTIAVNLSVRRLNLSFPLFVCQMHDLGGTGD